MSLHESQLIGRFALYPVSASSVISGRCLGFSLRIKSLNDSGIVPYLIEIDRYFDNCFLEIIRRKKVSLQLFILKEILLVFWFLSNFKTNFWSL